MLGGLAGIGIAIGGITYGTNWWHRFTSVQIELARNAAAWDAERVNKEQKHKKHLDALDIILGVSRNYTDGRRKSKTSGPLVGLRE